MGRNFIPDISTIGGFNYSWDFDIDEYKEWLADEELQNTPENYEEYIRYNVTFTCNYVDHETLHDTGDSADFTYEELAEEYGERVADLIRKDLESGKSEGYIEKMDLFDDDVDISDPYKLADIAMKMLPNGGYYKGARGFILANGTVVYTESEHNECGIIPGVNGTFHFIELGNIRVLPNCIDIGKKPTLEQKRTLAQVISSYLNDRLYVDFMTDNSEHSVTYTFYDEADWRTVLNEIDRFFNEGIKPQDRIFENKLHNRKKHMKKRIIRLNESELNRVIIESVKRVIREWDEDSQLEEGDEMEWYIDDVIDEFGGGPVVITGTLGLWDGKHEIQPVECEDIRSAIYKCIGRDGELLSPDDLFINGDTVRVIVHHHDGQNVFTITRAGM